ncbi:MAG: (2Fe-2S) ferredoxin domain-containing protein [Alphaproteobacteria bacterium]|nr:(2Fe-2S) ferredoxin domain-containing protein [Alphaproteobacteria bacterium]
MSVIRDGNESDPPLFFEQHVFCCTNVRPDGHERGCCSEKGSVALRDYMKAQARTLGIGRLRINASGCLDRCELGPTMVIYPEGVWYSYATKADVDEILQTHIVEGGRVARLRLGLRDKTAPR